MLFNALLLRSQQFDKMIREGHSPTYGQMEAFIDSIIFASHGHVTPEQLDNLCILFRKWKTIINHLHGERYTRSIDKPSRDFDVSKFSIDIPSPAKTAGRLRPNLPLLTLEVLIRAIDPYHAFYDEALVQIDPEYHQKRSNEGMLKEATDAFKQSALKRAEELYTTVMKNVAKRKELDYNHLFQISWSLHGLGNIEMVRERLRAAHQFFCASYEIKKQIPNLPKLFLLSTQAKMVATEQVNIPARGWHQDLMEFFVVFSHVKNDIRRDNRIWSLNLEEDIQFCIAKSLFYLDDFPNARSWLDDAIRIALKCNDVPGMLRARVWRGAIAKRRHYYLSFINGILSEIPPERKKNPYVRRIVSEISLQEISLLDADYAKAIQDAFLRASIEPLS